MGPLQTVSPGWFADNYLTGLEAALHLGMFSTPLGDGNAKRNAPPSNEDIASVVVGALIDPDTHAGKRYRPTGPELMSPNDLAAAMGQALGRKVKNQDISPKLMLKALKATAPPNCSVALLEAAHYYSDEYRRGSMAVGAPTRDVETVGGRMPESFESIARRYVAERQELRPSLAGKLKAIGSFRKILITRAPDVSPVEVQKDYIKLKAPTFRLDDDEWCDSHRPTDLKSVTEQAA